MLSTLKEAIEVFGTKNQERVCVEECAELIVEIQRKHRGRNSNVLEELIDVDFMITQLLMQYSSADVNAMRERKLSKLKAHLGGKTNAKYD